MEEKRVLTPRGAPVFDINPHRLAVLNKMGQNQGKNQMDQCDSGLGDSFKSQDGSFERSEQETASRLRDLSLIDEDLTSDDDCMKNRHPGPCQPTPTSAPSPVQSSPPQKISVENVMNFAQSNDFRYLLAPLRGELTTQNEDGDTIFHLAIIHGLPIIDALISIAPSHECLNISNKLAQTPLHLAVITKQPSVVHSLMINGARIDAVDRYGRTALHLAVKYGDMACIKVLTQPLQSDSGISENIRYCFSMLLDARDYNGFSALHLAVKEKFVEAVGLLVNLGANIELPDATAGRTAVHHAVEDNNLGMLRILLCNYKANVNAQRYDESTPLHIAAGRGLINITAFLLANGADLSISNSENHTPFDYAADEVLNVFKRYL